MSLPSSFFKTLTPEEAKEYHAWARAHATPEHFAKGGMYHPEVRAEWARMEAAKATESVTYEAKTGCHCHCCRTFGTS